MYEPLSHSLYNILQIEFKERLERGIALPVQSVDPTLFTELISTYQNFFSEQTVFCERFELKTAGRFDRMTRIILYFRSAKCIVKNGCADVYERQEPAWRGKQPITVFGLLPRLPHL